MPSLSSIGEKVLDVGECTSRCGVLKVELLPAAKLEFLLPISDFNTTGSGESTTLDLFLLNPRTVLPLLLVPNVDDDLLLNENLLKFGLNPGISLVSSGAIPLVLSFKISE